MRLRAHPVPERQRADDAAEFDDVENRGAARAPPVELGCQRLGLRQRVLPQNGVERVRLGNDPSPACTSRCSCRTVWGGIVGAFLAAPAGALLSGFLLPQPGISAANPPGLGQAVWAVPGSVAALVANYY